MKYSITTRYEIGQVIKLAFGGKAIYGRIENIIIEVSEDKSYTVEYLLDNSRNTYKESDIMGTFTEDRTPLEIA